VNPHPPDWRSLMYVPANAPRLIEKAHTRGADALIVDLEDSVPEAEKVAAREGLAAAVEVLSRGGADVLVRINQPLALAVRDLEAAVLHGVSGIVITKVDGASHVRLLDELVTALEAERGIVFGTLSFVVVIETPHAWLRMEEIFRASKRNVAAILGSEDFSLACDAAPVEETLLMPKQQMIITARACGLAPVGLMSSVADFSDQERVRAIALRSRHFGFAGATCIHPTQVLLVNEAFTPTELERVRAQGLIDAYEIAVSEGRGSVQFEGAMIDAPVVKRARRLLARGLGA
jgi:citrate lyase subunit beta/citryl-CoA lyase